MKETTTIKKKTNDRIEKQKIKYINEATELEPEKPNVHTYWSNAPCNGFCIQYWHSKRAFNINHWQNKKGNSFQREMFGQLFWYFFFSLSFSRCRFFLYFFFFILLFVFFFQYNIVQIVAISKTACSTCALLTWSKNRVKKKNNQKGRDFFFFGCNHDDSITLGIFHLVFIGIEKSVVDAMTYMTHKFV